MVFLSLNDADKPAGIAVAKRFRSLGLRIAATYGTAEYLAQFGVEVDERVAKIFEPKRDPSHSNAVELIENGRVTFVVNTPRGGGSRSDGMNIRIAANVHRVSSVTTVDAALAAAEGLAEVQREATSVRSLQEYHAR
jgi:carbamoyl-phosphate synthase large subunit